MKSFSYTLQAVVSNASMWDTLHLLPAEAQPQPMQQAAADTPMNCSFMHLHLGFDATGVLLTTAPAHSAVLFFVHGSCSPFLVDFIASVSNPETL